MQNKNTNATATAEETAQAAEPISAHLTIKWMPDGFAFESNISFPEVLSALIKLKDIDRLNHEETMMNIIIAAMGLARKEAQDFITAAIHRRGIGLPSCDCPKCVAKREAEKTDTDNQ